VLVEWSSFCVDVNIQMVDMEVWLVNCYKLQLNLMLQYAKVFLNLFLVLLQQVL